MSDLKEAFDLLDYKKEGIVDIAESLESLRTLEYDKKYPVIYNFVESIGEGKYTFDQFQEKVTILLRDVHDDIGTGTVYGGVAKAVCSIMMAASVDDVDECLEESGWNDEINEDYARRGGRR